MDDKKKNGAVYGAFMKGLAIALPAFITIAVFVWVWGLLKDNVVAPIIAGLDAPKVFAPREVTDAEKVLLGQMKEESDRQFANGGVKTFPDQLLEFDYVDDAKVKHYKLLRPPLPSEEPESYQGYSPLGKKRSPMQVVLDEYALRFPGIREVRHEFFHAVPSADDATRAAYLERAYRLGLTF